MIHFAFNGYSAIRNPTDDALPSDGKHSYMWYHSYTQHLCGIYFGISVLLYRGSGRKCSNGLGFLFLFHRCTLQTENMYCTLYLQRDWFDPASCVCFFTQCHHISLLPIAPMLYGSHDIQQSLFGDQRGTPSSFFHQWKSSNGYNQQRFRC